MGGWLVKGSLFFAWLLALLAVAGISQQYSGESQQFFGIADDQEQTIRFSSTVEIERFAFVDGQQVAAGDLLLEARRPQLDAQIQAVQEQIQALRYGNKDARSTIAAQLVDLQAQLQNDVAELDSQIRSLTARQRTNAALVRGSIVSSEDTLGSNWFAEEIASLQLRKRALSRGSKARIKDLQSKLDSTERPVDAQIEELTKGLQELSRQQAALKVSAKLNGQVGSVLFKVGDRVPPFEPVMTVHGTHPTFIKGYIHESVLNRVQTGQPVWVQATNAQLAPQWYQGQVTSLGSRIIDFPLRLKLSPMVQAWGREVVIDLPETHSLLLGEKVKVQLSEPSTWWGNVSVWLLELLP